MSHCGYRGCTAPVEALVLSPGDDPKPLFKLCQFCLMLMAMDKLPFKWYALKAGLATSGFQFGSPEGQAGMALCITSRVLMKPVHLYDSV